MTAFEAYQKFLAIKQHFSGNYDYFKYKGKLNLDPSKFEVRKDKYFFQKLAKRKDLEEFILANVVNRDITWVGDLNEGAAETTYQNWLMTKESLSYVFTEDMKKLKDGENFDFNFLVKDGQHPYLLRLVLQKKISFESFVILEELVKFSSYWNKKISETIIWPKIYQKCLKYKPFLRYDKENMKTILKRQIL